MNAAGRRLSESRVRENLMHGLRWQAMETETTAPSLDPTRVFTAKCSEPQAGVSNGMGEGSDVAKFLSLRTET